MPCSISTVYKAICAATQTPVIIKAYDKLKMKPKNLARLDREIRLMRHLGGGDGLVDLYCVFEDSAHKYLVRYPLPACSIARRPLFLSPDPSRYLMHFWRGIRE